MIKVTNSRTGKKEPFTPIEHKKASMYVCGITPYDYAHVGHGRVAVVFDLLYRLFKFLDFDVTYCRNFTDIDDKLLRRSQEELGDQLRYKELADKYIKAYSEDVKELNCLDPDIEPRVTDHISEIISFIQALVQNGNAYNVDGDVYFSISSFPNYGRLSKHKLEDLRSGSRVEVDTRKKDPLDFALWKKTDEGTFWISPWGYGRPGWHIECSVLASHYLGKQIDIHGGGMDLLFPHHENEIAQSEALQKKTFVNYWMHNAFVRIDKEKMSKSLGNFFTLRQVFEKFAPIIVRFYYINHQYRAPLDFSFEELESLEKSYNRLCRLFVDPTGYSLEKKQVMDSEIVRKMITLLSDDLNSPGMLGVLFQHGEKIKNDPRERAAVQMFVQEVLGLPLKPIEGKKLELTPELRALIAEREEARKAKDWKKADELRDKLKELGVDVQDKKA